MKYTKFNRHDHMTSEVMNEIMSIKNELFDSSTPSNLINMLYGLYDGYLYENLIIECQSLDVKMYTRVRDLYFTCKDYPVLD